MLSRRRPSRFRLAYRRAKVEARALLRYADPRGVGNDVLRATDFKPGALPVLLLPGFMSTRRGLTVIERRLRRDGYAVFSINLGGLLNTFNTRSIEESALLVREKVERLYRRYDLGPLAIVGHSKGGLIARYYVKRMGGHERCCTVVTLGSPHNGTSSAYYGALATGLFAPSVWQLMPMSPFIRRLKEGPFPPHVRLSSIWSEDDSISPARAARLDDEGRPNIVNVPLRGLAHHEFLTRKVAYEALRRELQIGFREAMEATESPLEAALRSLVESS